jgi:hypothetical protein
VVRVGNQSSYAPDDSHRINFEMSMIRRNLVKRESNQTIVLFVDVKELNNALFDEPIKIGFIMLQVLHHFPG